MPFVAPGEAFDLAYLDIERLALEAGPPPWRLCLVLVPNQVVDGLRAPIVRLSVSKPQSKKGPSWPMLVRA